MISLATANQRHVDARNASTVNHSMLRGGAVGLHRRLLARVGTRRIAPRLPVNLVVRITWHQSCAEEVVRDA